MLLGLPSNCRDIAIFSVLLGPTFKLQRYRNTECIIMAYLQIVDISQYLVCYLGLPSNCRDIGILSVLLGPTFKL